MADAPQPISTAAPPVAGKSLLTRLTDAASIGTLFSLLLHSLLLGAASLFYISYASDSRGLQIVATESPEEISSFETVEDVSFDVGGAESSTVSEAVLATPQPIDPLALPMLTSAEMADPSVKSETELIGEGTGEGTGNGSGNGRGVRLKAPSNAVSEGRFTAWTIPIARRAGEVPKPGESPKPGQSYHIVIELELPKTLRRYTVGDLKGTVIGTDGYSLRIPQQTFYFDEDGRLLPVRGRGLLPIVDNRVQILVYVPGAQELVRDRIVVGSKRLAETQTLTLLFES